MFIQERHSGKNWWLDWIGSLKFLKTGFERRIEMRITSAVGITQSNLHKLGKDDSEWVGFIYFSSLYYIMYKNSPFISIRAQITFQPTLKSVVK